MGYFLLWIESLAVSLLLVATMTACAGRLRRHRPRLAWALVTPLLLALCYAAMSLFTAVFQFYTHIDAWFWPIIALTIFFIAGAAFIVVRGLKYVDAERTSVAAADWPRGKLAVVLAAVAVLHSMTFWNMDLAARQQIAALRVEAGAVGRSVAPPSIPDRDNAAIIYQQAFEAMGQPNPSGSWQWDEKLVKAWNEKWTNWHDTMRLDFDLRDPQLRGFLARQAPAIKLLRQAAAKPDCSFDRDYGRPDISMLIPELSPLRMAANLLSLSAMCDASDGNYRQSVEDINAIFSIAAHIGRDPLLISALVSMAVDHIGIDSLQVVLEYNRVPAEDLAAVKLSVASYQTMLGRAFRTEETFRLTTCGQIAMGRYSIGEITNMSGGGVVQVLPNLISPAVYRVFFLGEDIAAQSRFALKLEETVHQPYWKVKDRLGGFDHQLSSNPGGIITALMMPALNRTLESAATAESRRDMARVALAILGYREKNGQFPEELDDLVPDFIATVPLDRFDGKPMKLKRTDRDLVVYSIGPDMIDNGGAPMDKEKTGDITFTLSSRVAPVLEP
jgi:hypothetical protein